MLGWYMNCKGLGWKWSWSYGDTTSVFAWMTEINHENLSQDSRYPGLHSNQAPPECDSTLYQAVRWFLFCFRDLTTRVVTFLNAREWLMGLRPSCTVIPCVFNTPSSPSISSNANPNRIKRESLCSIETSVKFHHATGCYITDDSHRRENLKRNMLRSYSNVK
jgi:hypothetical protein